MNPDQEKFLNLKTNPARLNAEEAAWCLGFSQYEIPILMSKVLLKPLGHPAPNAPKYFATTTVEALRNDVKWLNRATDTLMDYRRVKNAHKGTASVSLRQPQID
jgi:hypothetical protein